MPYFESFFVTVDYSEELNAVISTWKDYSLPEESMEGLEKCLELVKLKKAEYSITNLQLAMGGFTEINMWIATDYMPRVMETGFYKGGAIILPEDVFSAISLDELTTMLSKTVELRHFGDLEEAKKWIKLQHQLNLKLA